MARTTKYTTRREFLAGAAAAVAGVAVPRLVGATAGTGTASPTAWPPGPRAALAARRFDLLIAGGTVVDPAGGVVGLRDVAIQDGRIARVAEAVARDQADRVLDAGGMIVTPGLIDIHVHVYPGVANVAIEADRVGVERGVTALIDGGSAGATTLAGFRSYVVEGARSRVYALLNISRPGMTVPNETQLLSYLDPGAAAAAVDRNRDVVVGLKVRMLAGPEGHDLEVMRRTREAADRAGVPVMVHIGGQTSPLPRILELLRPGDVVTHALRQRGSVLDGNGRVYPAVREALQRGVHLDVGHGRGNLDFDVAEQVLEQGVLPTVISSDVHAGNFQGPVFDLPTTLSKFMHMGMTLEQVVERATATPAAIFDLGDTPGTLAEGAAADLSILELVEGAHEFVDSGGARRQGMQRLVPRAAVRGGVVHEAAPGAGL